MLREYLDLLSNSIWMVFKLPVWLWAFSVNICEFVGLNPEDDT